MKFPTACTGRIANKGEFDTMLQHGRRPQTRDPNHGGGIASLHMQTADDLFGGPQGSPRTEKLISASIQWAERIMEKIDNCPTWVKRSRVFSMTARPNTLRFHCPFRITMTGMTKAAPGTFAEVASGLADHSLCLPLCLLSEGWLPT